MGGGPTPSARSIILYVYYFILRTHMGWMGCSSASRRLAYLQAEPCPWMASQLQATHPPKPRPLPAKPATWQCQPPSISPRPQDSPGGQGLSGLPVLMLAPGLWSLTLTTCCLISYAPVPSCSHLSQVGQSSRLVRLVTWTPGLSPAGCCPPKMACRGSRTGSHGCPTGQGHAVP